jgi:trans-2,3-dihydro-3-hydroxyanthranilate isomerase
MLGRLIANSIAEDPATGSAAGPLGAYLVRHAVTTAGTSILEQGYEMGRPSLIRLAAVVEAGRLRSASIGGDAVIVTEGTIEA